MTARFTSARILLPLVLLAVTSAAPFASDAVTRASESAAQALTTPEQFFGFQMGTDAATGRALPSWGPWAAIMAGALVGILIGLVTEYYTSAGPIRRIAAIQR